MYNPANIDKSMRHDQHNNSSLSPYYGPQVTTCRPVGIASPSNADFILFDFVCGYKMWSRGCGEKERYKTLFAAEACVERSAVSPRHYHHQNLEYICRRPCPLHPAASYYTQVTIFTARCYA